MNTARKIDSLESLAKYSKMCKRLQNLLEQVKKMPPSTVMENIVYRKFI